MRKGEIARYEQFLLFPQCFQKACFPGASKGVIVWECVKILIAEFEEKERILTPIYPILHSIIDSYSVLLYAIIMSVITKILIQYNVNITQY